MPTEKIRFDWITVVLYLFLVLFGWLNIYAACYDETHAEILDFSVQHGKQLIWMGTAFVVALCVILIKPRIFSNIAYIIYGIVIALLILTLFIGTVTNGGQSWIDFGIFKLQPSEFAKFATALALAKYVGDINTDLKQRQTQLVLSAVVLIPCLLILLQHDTGSALVFTAFLLAFFREGLSPYILIIGVVAIVLFIAALLVNKFILMGILLLGGLAYLFLWLSKTHQKS